MHIKSNRKLPCTRDVSFTTMNCLEMKRWHMKYDVIVESKSPLQLLRQQQISLACSRRMNVGTLEVVTCARRTVRMTPHNQHVWNVESGTKPPAVVDILIFDTLRSWFLLSLSRVFCRADRDDENGESGNAPVGQPLPFLHHKVAPPLASSTPSRFDIHKRAQQKTGQALSPPHAPTSTPSSLPHINTT